MLLLIDLFPIRQVVHNGGSPNFQVLLFNKNITDMAQILQSLSYKECPIPRVHSTETVSTCF